MGSGKTLLVCLSMMSAASFRAEPARAADGALGMPREAASRPQPVRIENHFTATAVRGALHGATRRLQEARCASVFAEFADAEGRTLDQNLRALGETGGSYLEKMLFYDGKGLGRCAQSGVLAYTSPGSRVVLVCGPAFHSAYRGEPRLAEVVLIHETLHSLGLGENPPSSLEITARVRKACRR